LALAGLGVQFFATLLLFVYAGTWLDNRLGTSPLCLLLGLFVGGGGSFYLSYRRLMAPGKGR
jgi:F0F1-type ATP synthase assembly protein I